MARIATIIKENATLRDQLSPENRAYWDDLVENMRQQAKFSKETVLQRELHDLLPEIIAAQKAGRDAEDFFGGGPATIAIALGKAGSRRPWWWNWDLLVPLLIFTLGTILPGVILPAVPLQLLLVGVEYALFIVALVIGIWLTPRFTERGRVVAWLIVIIALLVAMRIAAKTIPPVGLVYLTRGGGSLVLLIFAVLVTGLTWWQNHVHPNSWLPAVLGSLWITTFLGLLARVPATSGLMVTASGNLLIALGTLLGDASVLIIGWHIWQARQHQTTND